MTRRKTDAPQVTDTTTVVVATPVAREETDPQPAVDAQAAAITDEATPDADEAAASDDTEMEKVQTGIYSVWYRRDADTRHRAGSVARVATGEWVAYSTTGHASRQTYTTRHDAAEALVASRRR